MAKRQPNPYFKFQQFTVFHDKCAMKVGTDGVLLGAWVDVHDIKSALDVGTGTGLISLMIAQRNNQLRIDAIDIDSNAVGQAKENISQSFFANQIEVQQVSFQDYSPDKKYDIIVSNPPFFNDSQKSPDRQRTLARHTDSLLIKDLLAKASKLLCKNGRLSIIYPYEYKDKLITLASEYSLNVSRITNIYPTSQSLPKRILIEFGKQVKILSEDHLIIEEERHKYTSKFNELVKDFYLKI